MEARWQKVFLAVIALVTLAFTLAIAADISPYLRGPDEWQWAYAPPGSWWRVGIPILTLVVYASLFIPRFPLLSRTQHPLRGFLFAVWLAAALIQISYLAISDQPLQQLFARTVSAGASGVFTVGSSIERPADFISRYPEIMPSLPVHPQRYPPGLSLSFYPVRQFFERTPILADPIANQLRLYQCTDFGLMRLSNPAIAAAVWQMALPLLSSLVVFPLFGLAHIVVNRPTAVWSVMVYPLLPSFVLWTGVWDQFYPLLAVSAWYFLAMGLRRQRLWLLFTSGLVVALGSFLTFGLLSLLIPLGLWAIFELLRQDQTPWSTAVIGRGALFFAGLTGPWIAYELAFGYGFREILAVSMGFHLGLRTYSTWLFYHLYDFGLFLGLPITLLFLAAVGAALKAWGDRLDRWLLPLAFGAGLLLLDISGLAQGEVARVWLFLTPFAVITAGQFWTEKLTDLSPYWLIVVLGVQLIGFGAFIRPLTTGVPDPPAYERQYLAGDPDFALEGNFAGLASLVGVDAPAQPVEPGGSVEIALYWTAHRPMQRPYTIFVHLIDAGGGLVAQSDQMPVDNSWPTTCWRPGEFVTDTHTLVLPQELADGAYSLFAGLYWLETGERLPVGGADASDNHTVLLHQLTVDSSGDNE